MATNNNKFNPKSFSVRLENVFRFIRERPKTALVLFILLCAVPLIIISGSSHQTKVEPKKTGLGGMYERAARTINEKNKQ